MKNGYKLNIFSLLLLTFLTAASLWGCGADLPKKELFLGGVDVDRNNLTYQELADILKDFGIDNISQDCIDGLEKAWAEMPEGVLDLNKVVMLLGWAGTGNYNTETWEWTPTSDIVYSFVMEAWEMDYMYVYLLQGIESIGKNKLVFTEVVQNNSEDYSRRTVTFKMNGRQCEFKTEVGGDWYDISILEYLNRILAEEGSDERLYFIPDLYGDINVFYCDAEWAAEFSQRTGCNLVTEVK